MDRVARLQDFWDAYIQAQSFSDNTFTGYGSYRDRTFQSIAGQVFGLEGEIRSRVQLPRMYAYLVEKGKQEKGVLKPHFDRFPSPIYLVHFGEVASTVVHVGKVLEDENGEVTHMESTPVELPSGHVLRLEASDYHHRGETDATKLNEVRQVLFFKAPPIKERIQALLGL